MSYHTGFLYLSNAYGNAVEVINEARAAANLQSAINAGLKRFGDVLRWGGCEGLAYEPCTMSSSGSITSWAAMNTNIAAAPWYVAGNAASAEGYGFFIEEWTGLDGEHHSRDTQPVGAGRQGGAFGIQSHVHRTMAINVILVGSSNRGLNHLFRWLESRLLMCCATDGLPSMWVREFCPTNSVSDITEGLARMDGVAMIGPLKWEAPPVEDSGCFIRRASFVLGAEGPCMFREPVSLTSETQTSAFAAEGTTVGEPAGVAEWVGGTMRTEVACPTPAFGMNSPRVTLTGPIQHGKMFPSLRIVGLLNPGGKALTLPGLMYPIGYLTTPELPADGSTYVYDLSTGSSANPVGVSSGNPWGQPMPRWFGFNNCQSGVIVVEPSFNYTGFWASTYLATQWTVAIEYVNRFGCC